MNLEEFQAGKIILIDKPLGWTSFQVVNKIRWSIRKHFTIKKIKVGHAGTLDPLASGLLILCVGKETKKIEKYQAQVKEYTGTITLGGSTPSFDLETEINKKFPTKHITQELVEKTRDFFLGEIDQKPPIFSALKKDGKRLYELAREGKTVEISTRKVTIYEFEIVAFKLPVLEFRIVCSKGTYIRSIANDFGERLNSGSHLSSLRRTKIGEYSVENSSSVESYVSLFKIPT